MADQSCDDVTGSINNVTITDISYVKPKFEGLRKDLFNEDGYVRTRVEDGTGDNIISNWCLSDNNYHRLEANKGFEVDMFCNEYSRYAGFELFNKSTEKGSVYDFIHLIFVLMVNLR